MMDKKEKSESYLSMEIVGDRVKFDAKNPLTDENTFKFLKRFIDIAIYRAVCRFSDFGCEEIADIKANLWAYCMQYLHNIDWSQPTGVIASYIIRCINGLSINVFKKAIKETGRKHYVRMSDLKALRYKRGRYFDIYEMGDKFVSKDIWATPTVDEVIRKEQLERLEQFGVHIPETW